MGYSLELHYCQGKITDISFIGHTECVCVAPGDVKCNTKSELQCQNNCHTNNDNPEKTDLKSGKKDCCETEKITFFSPTVKALSTTDLPALINLTVILNPSFFLTIVNEKNVAHDNYSPPLFKRDISILTRTFLI